MPRWENGQDEIGTGDLAPRPVPHRTWVLVIAAVVLTAVATHWWDQSNRDQSNRTDGTGHPQELALVLDSGSAVTHVEYGVDMARLEGTISVTNATGTEVTLLDLRSRGPVADLRSITDSLAIANGTVADWQVALRLPCGTEWPDGLYVRARARVSREVVSRVFYLPLWRGDWGRSVSRDCSSSSRTGGVGHTDP